MKITSYLPGMQMKKARAGVENIEREEGMAGLGKLFGHWLDLSPLDEATGRRKRVYDSTTTFLLCLRQILDGHCESPNLSPFPDSRFFVSS